jgi:hypothetical protein
MSTAKKQTGIFTHSILFNNEGKVTMARASYSDNNTTNADFDDEYFDNIKPTFRPITPFNSPEMTPKYNKNIKIEEITLKK